MQSVSDHVNTKVDAPLDFQYWGRDRTLTSMPGNELVADQADRKVVKTEDGTQKGYNDNKEVQKVSAFIDSLDMAGLAQRVVGFTLKPTEKCGGFIEAIQPGMAKLAITTTQGVAAGQALRPGGAAWATTGEGKGPGLLGRLAGAGKRTVNWLRGNPATPATGKMDLIRQGTQAGQQQELSRVVQNLQSMDPAQKKQLATARERVTQMAGPAEAAPAQQAAATPHLDSPAPSAGTQGSLASTLTGAPEPAPTAAAATATPAAAQAPAWLESPHVQNIMGSLSGLINRMGTPMGAAGFKGMAAMAAPAIISRLLSGGGGGGGGGGRYQPYAWGAAQ